MYILKFSEPKKNQVRVKYKEKMDKKWFQDQIRFSMQQINKVIIAGKTLEMNFFQGFIEIEPEHYKY